MFGKLRKQYDEEADRLAREASDIACLDESLTVQAPSVDADINVLVARFGLDKRGIPPAAIDPRFFGDFSEAPRSLQEAIHVVRDAQEKFDRLPPDLRARFRNDPSELWYFVNDPSNGAEAVKLGLLKGPPEPPPEPAVVVPTP